MAVQAALIILAPLVKKAVDSYLSTQIPEQVNRRIQARVQDLVNFKLHEVLSGLEHTKNIYMNLAAISLALTALQLALRNEVLGHFIYVLLYAIPLYMSLRSLRNLYISSQGILRMEKNIKTDISAALNEAKLPQKMLFTFYEKRSVDDLAKFTAGTIVFELIEKITEKKQVILKSVISYFISFLNIFLIRFFL